MVLWRISRYLDLKGVGGLRASGRWHRAGHPIVYLAESPASALLEVCVHTSANDVPPSFTLLRIEGPDGLSVPSVLMTDLPEDWATRPEVTQERGTGWLQRRESVLLRVPSAIVPETSNILFNPPHEQASAFRVTDTFAYPFDPRLKR
jgi:RES domain-containing protein